MAIPIYPEKIDNFKRDLKTLCNQYNVSDFVAIFQIDLCYTAIMQFSTSNRSNEVYNEIHKCFKDICNDIENDQRKQN